MLPKSDRASMGFVASSATNLSSTFTSQRTQVCSTRSERTRAGRRSRAAPTMKVYDVDIKLYGKQYTIPIDEEMTFLEGIEEFGLEVPYSCRAGVCITCAAKIISGDVDLGEAAITDELKSEGYVLTCSGFPLSDGIKLEMNQFEEAYSKQYGQYENED